jgi:hypothetical protein
MPTAEFKELPGLATAEEEAKPSPGDEMAELKLSGLISPGYAEAGFTPNIPEEIQVGVLRDGRLRVVSPIRVTVKVEEEHFVLEAVDLNEFGYGSNLADAIVDLQRTIAELYFTLELEANRLGPDLKQIFESLNRMIQKRA